MTAVAQPESERSKQSPRRRRLMAVFSWVGIFATGLGLVLGLVEIYERIIQGRNAISESANLVDRPNIVRIDANAPIGDLAIVADRIEIGPGTVRVPTGSVWVANVISLDEQAILRGETMAIVARSIQGGRIDVSGQPSGQTGGQVIVGGLFIDNLVIDARGGEGVQGTGGPRGPDGRGGRCDGFGRWRKAERGADGESGSPGGAGGAGGRVYLFTSANDANVAASVSGGVGGVGGAGGEGGRGGRGCVGLGGSQSNAADGKDGSPGANGAKGSEGRLFRTAMEYAELRDIVHRTRDPRELPLALIETAQLRMR